MKTIVQFKYITIYYDNYIFICKYLYNNINQRYNNQSYKFKAPKFKFNNNYFRCNSKKLEKLHYKY